MNTSSLSLPDLIRYCDTHRHDDPVIMQLIEYLVECGDIWSSRRRTYADLANALEDNDWEINSLEAQIKELEDEISKHKTQNTILEYERSLDQQAREIKRLRGEVAAEQQMRKIAEEKFQNWSILNKP